MKKMLNLLRAIKKSIVIQIIKIYALKYLFVPSSYWKNFNRLEIGSGPRKRSDWLTLDYCFGADVIWNLNKKLPFPDGCFDTVYSSHVLEHFKPQQLKFLLMELHRVLKVNGTMLICVPDASLYIDAYINKDSKGLMRYQPAVVSKCRMDFLNYIFYMDGHHHMMFDFENLKYQVEQSGFKNYRRREFEENLDSEERRYESLYVICEKLE